MKRLKYNPKIGKKIKEKSNQEWIRYSMLRYKGEHSLKIDSLKCRLENGFIKYIRNGRWKRCNYDLSKIL